MLLYLGWIAAAFLGGFLLALQHWSKPHSLRDSFSQVDSFKGRSYREILAIAGARPDSIIQQTNGHVIKEWKETGYSIALAFDTRDVCLGVMNEQY